MATGNCHLAEVMLREIGRAPGPELEGAEDRESYALAAGIALGMITLTVRGRRCFTSNLVRIMFCHPHSVVNLIVHSPTSTLWINCVSI